jgi:hypothetical protein
VDGQSDFTTFSASAQQRMSVVDSASGVSLHP